MKILIGGGYGLIGQKLSENLRASGHVVKICSRRSGGEHTIHWDLDQKTIDSDEIFDVVINLAGAGIVDKAWTDSYKQLIIDSRVDAVETFDRYFQRLEFAPSVYINASAVGIYGSHPDKDFSEEESAMKDDFLVHTCKLWEKSVNEMLTYVERTYIVRIGVVLSNEGGAFPKLSQGHQVGIVPHLGSGRQIISWIHEDDIVGIFEHLILKQSKPGIYNAVAPEPVSNKDMSRAIAKKGGLGWSPAVPKILLDMILGERTITVLGSTKVSSKKIESQGYSFVHPTLDDALINLMEGY